MRVNTVQLFVLNWIPQLKIKGLAALQDTRLTWQICCNDIQPSIAAVYLGLVFWVLHCLHHFLHVGVTLHRDRQGFSTGVM